jgi:hypothetical protein
VAGCFNLPNASRFAFCVGKKRKFIACGVRYGPASSRRMPAYARITLMAVALLLLLTLLWPRSLRPPAEQTEMGAKETYKPAAPIGSMLLEEIYDQILSAAPEGEKPLPFKTKTRVHLRPGESAVIGFWQISKDSNGLAVITPTVLSNGNMALQARLLKISDAAASEKAVHDLFPAPFDVEQSGAMKPDALANAMSHLQSAKGVDVFAAPTVVTRPGMQASIMVGQMEPGDADPFEATLQSGWHLDITPGIPATDGSFDLDLGLDLK